MKKQWRIWEQKAASEDYAAAQKYLTLLFVVGDAKRLAKALRAAPTMEHAAKDLLRASQTHLLEKDNPHVEKELKKIKKGEKLSPIYSSVVPSGSGSPSPRAALRRADFSVRRSTFSWALAAWARSRCKRSWP
jgi:hypothetical protein